ncbi:MAG: DUF1501 domain-containing protein [Gemmatimonadetes bacterium]|nr:DUF1501 domain-containing protein [Gemmatimonadota bacterium]
MDRRSFLERAGMCFGGVATFGYPTVRFASVPEPGRLVFVLLRGGFDGLAAVVPTGDPDYAGLRGAMAFDAGDLVSLESGFGLAPGLAPLRAFWDDGELMALHAMAIPYRTRSHFDGQAILETGLDRPEGSSDGWLNRLLQVMEGDRSGIAVAAGMPRSMIGDHPVSTWSPVELGAVDDAYLDHLHLLYRSDRRLFNRFEAALQQRDLTAEAGMGEGMDGEGGMQRPGRPGTDVASLFRAAARLIRPETGPNVAALELSGWDTHANQGLAGGALDRLLGRLAEGLLAFRDEMESAWANTTVVVMTEFGRTAQPNGTRGTDHGTAGAGFVIGPRIARSAVVADWPGLGERDLYEGRDLTPTTDTRAVLKGIVTGAFDLTAAQADRVFPGSEGVRGRIDLMA